MSELIPGSAGEAPDYSGIHGDIVALLEAARRAAARSVNALMTASYWEIGRRIVEFEQGGQERADYGQALLKRLSIDLSARFGRGFSVVNLQQMRNFYRCWPPERIYQTASDKSPTVEPSETASRNFIDLPARQLDRQVNSQFYERIALSRNKAAMLQKAEAAEPGDAITPEQALKDPFVLEFLNLKDEYSESDLEDALIQHLA
nr:DUF1016 N-terminal domain-containing protein [Hydrogenophaga sp.]